MTLIEIVEVLSTLDDSLTIYAKEPWPCASEAVVVIEPEDGLLPIEAKKDGLGYFLEVILAKELLEGWLETQNYVTTVRAQCERLVQYAETDA